MNVDTRIKKAEKRALQNLDYIIDSYSTSDFVEIVGRIGGDTITYRIYLLLGMETIVYEMKSINYKNRGAFL